MADMDRDGSIINGNLSPTSPPTVYSPAYNQQSGPFGASGKKSPGLNLRNEDYVASAAKHGGRSEMVDVDDALAGAVDIDEALNNDSSFQFSSTTTQDLKQNDNNILRETTQQFTNLNTGESNINEFSSSSPLASSGAGDNLQARSVTTRQGSIHEDARTGERYGHLETKTMASSQVVGKDGSMQEETFTSVSQRKTSRKESTMSQGYSTNVDTLMTSTAQPQSGDDNNDEGTMVSSQTITSKTRTVETTTYSVQQGDESETHIEQKVTIQSDGDPIDHDEALAQAIQEATAMNPDFTVEKIEINQTAQVE